MRVSMIYCIFPIAQTAITGVERVALSENFLSNRNEIFFSFKSGKKFPF